jgi:hypothetical protein
MLGLIPNPYLEPLSLLLSSLAFQIPAAPRLPAAPRRARSRTVYDRSRKRRPRRRNVDGCLDTKAVNTAETVAHQDETFVSPGVQTFQRAIEIFSAVFKSFIGGAAEFGQVAGAGNPVMATSVNFRFLSVARSIRCPAPQRQLSNLLTPVAFYSGTFPSRKFAPSPERSIMAILRRG